MRPSQRQADQLRDIKIELGYAKHAEGSCLIHFGETKVLCTATVEEKVPPFIKDSGAGWVTAEYGMLPRSTHTRMSREAAQGKQTGRTQEIQRLIGRALRSVTDFSAMGERQIKVDCDVIQADGGTRTAAITGGYLALHMAFQKLKRDGIISKNPLTDFLAAISCGIINGEAVLDLDYMEDSNAIADANFVITGSGKIVEIQATAEQTPFERWEFDALLKLAEDGIKTLIELQRQVLKEAEESSSAA